MANKQRCAWAEGSDLMREYHDDEWGRPSRDDQHLFEMLILEGAQAGLSWSTILNKRDTYRKAFSDFDVAKVARFNTAKQAKLMENPGIVRNRLKISSTIGNAIAFKEVQREFGDFASYLWGFVDNRTIVNKPKTVSELPAKTNLSDRISKDLKKRGFRFVGSTIVYSYMQAVGLIDDHIVGCPSKTGNL